MTQLHSKRSLVVILITMLALFLSALCLAPSRAFADTESEADEQETVMVSTVSDEEIAQFVAQLQDYGMSNGSVDDLDLAAAGLTVGNFSGRDRYDTNAQQALAGWTSSEKAIIVTGTSWADALSVSGLAGALDCPIIMVQTNSIPAVTKSALSSLGVRSVIIVGGEGVVSSSVVSQLNSMGISVEKRLGGADRYATQMQVYNYGLEQGFWGSTVVVASGVEFADALSIAPAAFAQAMPIFLADADGGLSLEQKQAIATAAREGTISDAVLLGGESRVGVYTEGLLTGIALVREGECQRLAGSDRYDTSLAIAKWAVDKGYLQWNQSAFATGTSPFDALGGGALQGKTGAPVILISASKFTPAIYALKNAEIEGYRFFGGTGAVPTSVRNQIAGLLSSDSRVVYRKYSTTLDRAAQIEKAAYPYNDSLATIRDAMDPSLVSYGENSFYEFATIRGYTGKFTAADLDAYIAANVVYQERNYGCTSVLRGSGAAIINAARTYDINEAYLLAHTALETAWGCSPLSQGKVIDGVRYYNFFGIGAYDSNPNNGFTYAKQQGWNTVEKGLVGGAEWLASRYINPTVSTAQISGAQDTLYKMRWDLQRIDYNGTCTHQYATSLTWATGVGRTMANVYSSQGMSMDNSGLVFEVPEFA